MLATITSAFVIFREGFEAILLVMLMGGMVRGRQLDWRALAAGSTAGVLGSTALALFIHDWVEDHHWFEAAINLAAAAVLLYVVIWNRHVQAHIKEHLDEVRDSSLWLGMLTVSLIFLREGAEIVLMLASVWREDAVGTAVGGAVGTAALAAVAWIVLTKLLSRLDLGMVFRWSNAALAVLALWFLAQGMAELISLNS